MSAPVPGQTFEIRTRLTNRGSLPITPTTIEISADRGWEITADASRLDVLTSNTSAARAFRVALTPDVPISSRPYFHRTSIQESRYTLADPAHFGRPAGTPPAVAIARYQVAGVAVEKRQVVQRREPKPPYGDAVRELRVVPAVAVRVTPSIAMVPLSAAAKEVRLTVDLLNNEDAPSEGQVSLTLPPSWTSDPADHRFTFTRAGERAAYSFTVRMPALADRSYTVEAAATANGRRYVQGYDILDHRDLELRYLYRPSIVDVRGVDVAVVPGLEVGYVMGVGDQVPAGIAQLGYRVTLLDDRALAAAPLNRFDAIVTGTRAYAVRDDLKTYNRRLLEYVSEGGNLIVLYNTQELVPARFAPYPADHGPNAEEVSEEDSPVTILAPAAQAFAWPNRITNADFDGWVEQRGSKFWAAWDAAYTPMLETFDQGQAPQRGGWLQASYGKGRYTYFAYALHRQLPYGVRGAYRLLANLLALGRTPPQGSR